MTEMDWLDETDVETLLLHLNKGKINKRKLRLFGCALCRRLRFPPVDADHFIDMSEKFADRRIRSAQLAKAQERAWRYFNATAQSTGMFGIFETEFARKDTSEAVARLVRTDCDIYEIMRIATLVRTAATTILKEQACHAHLLRDIFGNPFHRVRIHKDWLTWRDRLIPNLAEAAYEDRPHFNGHLSANRLTILADALEEAGCTQEDLLGHLRGPEPHVRGCWVIDLLRQKR